MEGAPQKRCSRCKNPQSLSEFYKDRSRRDGHSNVCKGCERERGRERKDEFAAYRKTTAGLARTLRCDHGYPYHESRRLSHRLLDDSVRCEICGIPNWLIKLNYKKGGPWFLGSARQNTRMHPDRVDTTKPHTLNNTRLLCPTCNLRRSAEKYTDEQVLRWVRKRWLSIFSPRLLFWLNTEPGKGGRDRRNPHAN